MTDSITIERLPNGLRVLLKEIHTAPIISHWIWYRVGSRNEVAGKTGLSHWVEHMQFKGTPTFPAGLLDRAISRDGGLWNAFTHLDWTTFFETMPDSKIDLALELEADRMVNSIFDPAEVESERTVIMSEREASENEPLFLLDEAVQSASFKTHPYRSEVLGSMADLRTIRRDDLYTHYQNHYHPANAVVAVAGDFETGKMLEKVGNAYGNIPAREPIKPVIPAEIPVSVEQLIEVNGPGETTYIQVAYLPPTPVEEDFFPFTILDSLLTGPTSLNMFGGGGISNKTSRLYRRLVEREYTVSVNGSLQATIDPFIYSISLTVRPDKKPEEVLAQLDEELGKLLQEPLQQAEIDRASKQARALFAYGSENITNQAFWMGYSEMFDRYTWYLNYVKRLEEVTAERVSGIARKYLQRSQRVVGIYRPNGRVS